MAAAPFITDSATRFCSRIFIGHLFYVLCNHSANTHRNTFLSVLRQRTAVDVVADCIAPDNLKDADHSWRWMYDRSDMRLALVTEAHHAEDVQPLASEVFYGRGDADQADHTVRALVDQKR